MSGQLSLDGFEQRPSPLLNLFFALKPDDKAVAQSAALARQLGQEQGIQVKDDRIQRFHVTLFHVGHFQGDVPSGTMAAAKQAAQSLQASPFTITFDKVASFSGRSHNLPIILRGAETSTEFMRFQADLDLRLKRAGLIHGESRGHYTPHLTLFYGNSPVKERAIEPITWRVQDFVLLSSLYGAGVHQEEGRWSLHAASVPAITSDQQPAP